jgi:hypothetical protein
VSRHDEVLWRKELGRGRRPRPKSRPRAPWDALAWVKVLAGVMLALILIRLAV